MSTNWLDFAHICVEWDIFLRFGASCNLIHIGWRLMHNRRRLNRLNWLGLIYRRRLLRRLMWLINRRIFWSRSRMINFIEHKVVHLWLRIIKSQSSKHFFCVYRLKSSRRLHRNLGLSLLLFLFTVTFWKNLRLYIFLDALSFAVIIWIIRVSSCWFLAIFDGFQDCSSFENAILALFLPGIIVWVVKDTQEHNKVTASVESHGMLFGDCLVSSLFFVGLSEHCCHKVLYIVRMICFHSAFWHHFLHCLEVTHFLN